MARPLSRTFPSLKSPNPTPKKASSSPPKPRISLPKLSPRSWCVYLILSTNVPIKTYVGVTTDFPRRLKQHNGELKGGAKASRAGRPWVCACIIRGFKDQSEACKFESKWKSFSRKSPRKRENEDVPKHLDETSLLLLQHREAALKRVKGLFGCCHLEIDWPLNPY
ncbi:structure-specific endonuclease subunit slx1-like [Alnus glutinosa]|uniref:structure-specific endonuclease subunit slx1-like n=1 Tax=Alnus glutinosa TaxID=3517 RepID=UPI002D781635|nr:structure-specific endonuclease subunit slx1-like [Alnus glutinosa]